MKITRRVATVISFGLLCFFYSIAEPHAIPLIVEKNLFSQDRKPPSDEPAPTPQNKSNITAKMIQLDGIIFSGEKRKALLRVKGQVPGMTKGKTQAPYLIVSEGERIGDYQVVKINQRSISLEKDRQVDEISLFAAGKVAPAPPPPVPGVPGSEQPGTEQGVANQGQPGPQAQIMPQPPHPAGMQGPPGVNRPGRMPQPEGQPPAVGPPEPNTGGEDEGGYDEEGFDEEVQQ